MSATAGYATEESCLVRFATTYALFDPCRDCCARCDKYAPHDLHDWMGNPRWVCGDCYRYSVSRREAAHRQGAA